jgi:hypothetical protein
MKTYVGVEVIDTPLLTSASDRGEWSASRLGRFTPGEIGPGTHRIEGWVGPRGGLDAVRKRKTLLLLGFEPRPSSQPLRGLSYPNSTITTYRAVCVDTHTV